MFPASRQTLLTNDRQSRARPGDGLFAIAFAPDRGVYWPQFARFFGYVVQGSYSGFFIYNDVGRLGVDRCLAMVAAYDRYQGGVLVIDCGSAMTADLILATGEHVGGYIFPGFSLLKQSLLSGTYKVIVSANVEQSYKLGTNTEECVDNGGHMMVRSTLYGLIELAAGYGVSNVLLTGGDGLKAKALIGGGCEYDKDLVFKGLGMVSPYSLD